MYAIPHINSYYWISGVFKHIQYLSYASYIVILGHENKSTSTVWQELKLSKINETKIAAIRIIFVSMSQPKLFTADQTV